MICFTDRNLGHLLPIAMSLLGLQIELHDSHFTQSTPDDEWIPFVGRRGWRVLTQDPRFLANESEKQAVIDHAVGCFVLVADQMNRWDKLRLIAKTWDQIEAIAAAEPVPFVYRVSRTG